MDKKLRRLGIALVMSYLAIFVKLHQTQLIEVEALAKKPDNNRETLRKLNQPRGKIISADGALLAESIDVGGNMVPRKRLYPQGDLFGHITGYQSGRYRNEGVEKVYDQQLSGVTLRQQFDGLTTLFAVRENVGHVQLTVRRDLQDVARQQIGDREGAAVVLDPRTGAILALWSNPSYDPGELTANGDTAAQEAWARLSTDARNPMRSKAFRERYNPGSTYKAVTAAVGMERGGVTASQPSYAQLGRISFPDYGGSFTNFTPDKPCGGPLPAIMTVSCNTAFMQMGVDNTWPDMAEGSRAFGWNQDVPVDLPGATRSSFPDAQPAFDREGIAGLAQASIGQKANAATPLQIAMVAAAAANGGVIMKPHVMATVRNQDAAIVETQRLEPWLTAMSRSNADALRQVLLGPVNDPNGSAFGQIRVPAGMKAGGKTGTAQTGGPLHVWFMGFAGPEGQPPTVAVAVVLLRQPARNDITGGRIAAPVANAILNKALEVVDAGPADPSGLVAPTTTTVPPAGPSAPTTTRR